MDIRVTKKNIETLKNIIVNFGYEEEMREFSKNFPYPTWQKLVNATSIILQEEYYQKNGVYKLAHDIYGKKIVSSLAQQKRDARQMQIDYLNIKVPLNDFHFLGKIIK